MATEKSKTRLFVAGTPSPRLYLAAQDDSFVRKSETRHYEDRNGKLVLKSVETTFDRVPALEPRLYLNVRK